MDDERHVELMLIEPVAVLPSAMLEEFVTMIRDHDDDGIVEQALHAHGAEQSAEALIEPPM